MPCAPGRPPAAVLFDLYDTLVHASPRRSFYRAVPAYVGDGGDGELGGARRLGLRTVLVERGLPDTGSARADADVCCADLAEAGRVLLGWKTGCESHAAIRVQHLLQTHRDPG
jgi:FMN phosphatase YigB (HAD superfamily)